MVPLSNCIIQCVHVPVSYCFHSLPNQTNFDEPGLKRPGEDKIQSGDFQAPEL